MRPLESFIVGAQSSALVIWALFGAPSALQVNFPPELSEEERGSSLIVQRMTPMEIRLRVLARSDFDKERPSENTVAFSYLHKNPCEIVLPEGYEIAAEPKTGTAIFASRIDASVLAHEILHCVRGAWHAKMGAD